MHETCLIVTCEHGGNDIPAEFASLFEGLREALDSHRGYDPGALELARHFADTLGVPLFATTISRLLIDCNRSPHNRTLISSATRSLTGLQKEAIIQRYYLLFRQSVERFIAECIQDGRCVLHLSVHTFTPVFNGAVRHGDIGLLYDPVRKGEREFCLDWQSRFRKLLPGLVIRRNYPYRGTSDGFVSWLRRQYSQEFYLGCELEVSQKYPSGIPGEWRRVRDALVESFRNVVFP